MARSHPGQICIKITRQPRTSVPASRFFRVASSSSFTLASHAFLKSFDSVRRISVSLPYLTRGSRPLLPYAPVQLSPVQPSGWGMSSDVKTSNLQAMKVPWLVSNLYA